MMRLMGIALTGVLLTAGCGYHISGQGAMLPKTIKTIAVPGFRNNTQRYELARLLPADITREFIARTKYQIVGDASQADAVLQGTVLNYMAFPTVTDPSSGRATGAQVIVVLAISLTETSTGKVLYSNPGMEFRERYQISTNPQEYLDESGTAIQRVSKDVGQTVVSAILESF
jgi:hypothetical protein